MEQLATLSRALQVLQAFSYEHPEMGVSELARQLGMSKAAVHRILSTLANERFVVKTVDDRYRLGLRVHELGQLVVSGLEIRQVAHEPLDRLHVESGETVHMAVLDGPDAIYIHRLEAQSTLGMFARLGRRIPAHTTSSGKCLLAFGPPEAVDAVIESGLARVGPRSITTAAMLRAALADIRANGYVLSIDENQRGVLSIGAPVFDHLGTCIAAVSVAGRSTRITDERLPRFIRLVRQCASEISTGMGYLGVVSPPRTKAAAH